MQRETGSYGTNVMQLQVRQFMDKMHQHRASSPSLPPADVALLRYRLIDQESHEVKEAILDKDMVQIIDGICDLLYVAFGAAEAHGVDIAMYFDEVHRTNMAKDPAYVDEYGKVVKPPGWVRPRIAQMLALETESAALRASGGEYTAALDGLTGAERHRMLKGEWTPLDQALEESG